MVRDSLVPIVKQTKLIPIAGGTINLAGTVNFTVPARALSTPVEIQVRLQRHRDAISLHFEPAGLVFRFPSQLTIDSKWWTSCHKMGPPDIYYRSHQLNHWQRASFVNQFETPDAFHIQIPHFSSYYFIRREVYSTSQLNRDDTQGQSEPHKEIAKEIHEGDTDNTATPKTVEPQSALSPSSQTPNP